jgi:hypothetical protein
MSHETLVLLFVFVVGILFDRFVLNYVSGLVTMAEADLKADMAALKAAVGSRLAAIENVFAPATPAQPAAPAQPAPAAPAPGAAATTAAPQA